MVADMECLLKKMGLGGADGREEITEALSKSQRVKPHLQENLQ